MRTWTRITLPVCLLSATVLLVSANARADAAARSFQRSYELEAAKRYAEAVRVLGQMPAAQRGSYFAQLRLGWLSYLAKKHAQASRAYRAAIARAPKAVEPWLGLMLVQMATRGWQDALKSARRALSLAPGNDTDRTRLAWILFNLGRYAESEKAYRQVLRHYPANLELQRGLGWALLKQGKKQAARRVFQSLVSHAPADTSAAQGLRLAAR
jgi:tetratricopeptide (TPR) repeat protein